LGRGIFGVSGKIKILNFGHNKIRGIEERFFDELISLEYLNFQGNEIEVVYKDWFKNCGNLKYVNFKDNLVRSLEKGHFLWASDSRIQQIFLDFSGNKILDIESQMFDESITFQKIDISGNEMQWIPKDFMRNISAAYVDLSRNNISVIEKEAFNFNALIQVLDLSYNQLEHLNSGWFKIEDPKIYSDLILNLNNNQIKDIPDDFFKDFHPATINLAHNQIEEIWTVFDSVSSINLSNNKIKEISPESFTRIGYRIIRIDLENNVCFNETLNLDGIWSGKTMEFCSKLCVAQCFNVKMISFWK
jgi:Leucine-rich repeat (LRR) protein